MTGRARFQPSPLPTGRKQKLPARLLRSQGKAAPASATAAPRSSTAAMLGEQIRSLRMAAGISASALAAHSGISRSMLSRVERGAASPSIEAMERIATALDVPISRFFVDQVKRTDCSFVPAHSGLVVEREGVIRGYRYELLGHLLSGNLFVEPYRVTITRDAQPYTTFQHTGVKFLHFLSGRVRYRYAGRVMEVGPGDSLMFDATALHGAEEILERPVEYLSVVFNLRE
jgi:transcriptional regulator with XRE-family HTH domain